MKGEIFMTVKQMEEKAEEQIRVIEKLQKINTELVELDKKVKKANESGEHLTHDELVYIFNKRNQLAHEIRETQEQFISACQIN